LRAAPKAASTTSSSPAARTSSPRKWHLCRGVPSRREAADLGDRGDILSLLLRAQHEHAEPLSDRELRDELTTLLIAGHETTTAALSWARTEVARDPEAQARLANGEPDCPRRRSPRPCAFIRPCRWGT
jgi:cytochrome P450